MNRVFNSLVYQNFRNFKNSFDFAGEVFWDTNKNRLIHPGEFGVYRENLAKTWLRTFVPSKFGLGSGFLITPNNRVSTQCDIVFYDNHETPIIENLDNQKFYPIETVAGVIEIKSDINSIGELNSHLIKLAELKKFREDVKDPEPYNRSSSKTSFNPEAIPFDNIFTILICNKFNFDLNVDNIDYLSIPVKHHHNFILSLNDGAINYATDKGTKNLFFSFMGSQIHKKKYLKNSGDDELPLFIKNFLNSLHFLLKNTCLHRLDTSYYFMDDPVEKII